MDIDAYFQRIGCDRPAAPTLDALGAILLHHPLAIPFENLSPLTGGGVSLSIEDLERKLLHEGRGGYCFEHNTLLQAVLRDLGFAVTGLAARVLWNRPEDTVSARTHMVLTVNIEGQTYLADAGFGGMTLTAPLKLQADIEQETPHGTFRLLEEGGFWTLQTRLGNEWRNIHRFDLQAQEAIDYELPNHYVATHPLSPFVNNLMVSRVVPEGRYALMNRQFTVYTPEGGKEQRTLEGSADMLSVLANEIGIALPDIPGLAERLDQLPH